MNIVYHASDSFAKVTCTSIVSIFENNKNIETITVYIIERGFSEENKNSIIKVASDYGRKVFFIPMPDINSSERLGLKKIKEKWVFDSYCRLFLDKILPENVERVLYLDGDILNIGSLESLWNMDLGNVCAAAVIDCLGEKYYNLLDLGQESMYCNSGVILFDLVKWRENEMGTKVRKYVNSNKGFVFFMEQTVFNAVLSGAIKVLHPKYNTYSMMQILSYDEIIKLRKVKRYYSRDEVSEAIQSPVLVHMTSSFMIINRPWSKVTNHPMKEEYAKYAKLTPWEDYLQEDSRKIHKKISDFFIQHIPKKLLIVIVSIIYNDIRVHSIKKKIKKFASVE